MFYNVHLLARTNQMRTGLPTDRAAFIEVDEELMQVAIDTYVYLLKSEKKLLSTTAAISISLPL